MRESIRRVVSRQELDSVSRSHPGTVRQHGACLRPIRRRLGRPRGVLEIRCLIFTAMSIPASVGMLTRVSSENRLILPRVSSGMRERKAAIDPAEWLKGSAWTLPMFAISLRPAIRVSACVTRIVPTLCLRRPWLRFAYRYENLMANCNSLRNPESPLSHNASASFARATWKPPAFRVSICCA